MNEDALDKWCEKLNSFVGKKLHGHVSRHHSQLMECFKDEERELNAKKERDNPYWLTRWSPDDGDFSHHNDNTSGKREEKVSD